MTSLMAVWNCLAVLFPDSKRRRPGFLLLLLGGGIVSLAGHPLRADGGDSLQVTRAQSDDRDEEEEEEDDSEDVAAEPDRFRRASQRKSQTAMTQVPASGDGPGVIGQAGHLAFRTFGRNDSITPIEVLPYILTDEHFFFSDLRGFISNNAMAGGNVGLGYRNLREDYNAWYGGSLWYDADATSGKLFQQIGLSFEGLIERWEFRSNVYIPVTQSQNFANTISGAQIVGHQLLYNQYTDLGKSMTGIDVEAGYNIPVMEKHRLRGFVGYYHFDGGAIGAINGFKTRVEGVINNSVTAQVMYTNDPLFGSNVMVGCTVQFPFGDKHPANKWKQNTPSPFRFVERNYNVIISHAQGTESNKVAIDPSTNAAYNIQQISSSGGVNGDGTTTNPYSTVLAAQNAGGNVLIVQGNSVLTESVVLAQNQHLLGDGTNQSLAVAGGGTVRLPTLIAASQTPKFTGSVVTLASNSEFAGFTVSGNTGSAAVTGTNVIGASLHDLTFQNVNGDAVYLNNPSGNIVMNNIVVNGATGNGLNINGGNANLSISGTTISNTTDNGIVLANLSGGTVNINNPSLQGTGLAGLYLNDVSTNVVVRSLTATQTTGPAVSITGGTTADTYRFMGLTAITQPKGMGFSIATSPAVVTVDGLQVTSSVGSPAVSVTDESGTVNLTSINLTTSGGTALVAKNAAALNIPGGVISTTNASAIDISNSTINTSLSSVSVNGGPFGISLVNTVGNFNIVGGGGYATGGTIQNTTTGMIFNSAGTVNVSWVDLTSNGVGVQSANNTQISLSGLRVTGSTGYAVDSENDGVFMLTNSILSNNGALGGGTIRAQADALGSYQWLVQGNTIVDHNGTPVLMQTQLSGNGASLAATVQGNAITADRGGSTLVNINWYGPMSVAVSNNTMTIGSSAMTGISVVNSSSTDSTVANVLNNALTFSGATANNGTGINIAAAASSTYEIGGNSIVFGGTGGTGLNFNLTGTTTAWITSNTITDQADGATGMLFDNVAANSRLQIESNTITLMSTDLTLHRGIIFMAVAPTIQLLGNYNNTIDYASPGQVFVIPVNSSSGQIGVNGTLVP
jgi:Inverse autotransporter, beta-domain